MDTNFTLNTNYPPKFVLKSGKYEEKSDEVSTTEEEDLNNDGLGERALKKKVKIHPPTTKEEIDWLISYVDKNSHPRRVLTDLISVAKRSHNWDLMFKLLEGMCLVTGILTTRDRISVYPNLSYLVRVYRRELQGAFSSVVR